MCEQGEINQLTRLGFAGLEGMVEERLSFKTRVVDPLSAPDYASVLYAWHIFKGDYRSGKHLETITEGRTHL